MAFRTIDQQFDDLHTTLDITGRSLVDVEVSLRSKNLDVVETTHEYRSIYMEDVS